MVRLLGVILATLFVLALLGAVHRDSHGRIARSRAAVHRFEILTGHPQGWPGHVVDHIVPLVSGGLDDPINMQWQTDSAGKAKDRIEQTLAALVGERALVARRIRCLTELRTE